MVSSQSTQVIVADLDGRIAGMALLRICTTLAGQFGLVEEVAVDERPMATTLESSSW